MVVDGDEARRTVKLHPQLTLHIFCGHRSIIPRTEQIEKLLFYVVAMRLVYSRFPAFLHATNSKGCVLWPNLVAASAISVTLCQSLK